MRKGLVVLFAVLALAACSVVRATGDVAGTALSVTGDVVTGTVDTAADLVL